MQGNWSAKQCNEALFTYWNRLDWRSLNPAPECLNRCTQWHNFDSVLLDTHLGATTTLIAGGIIESQPLRKTVSNNLSTSGRLEARVRQCTLRRVQHI
jgi:hypothetical protein